MELREFVITTLYEYLNEQNIPLRLVQGGALTNPPKKLYHATAYKISYDELNMHEHRSKDGKGFNHTAKGSGYIGVYFYEEKYIGFNVKEKIGDIHLVTYKDNTAIDYAHRSADKLKSEFAYVYEAEISDDVAILDSQKFPGNVGGVKEKDLDQYAYNTKIKAREYDGSGGGEFIIWNKDVIKSWNIKLIAVKNPYYGNVYEKWRDKELKERWIDTLGTVGAHYLSIAEYIWFTDVSKVNYFLENYNKNKNNMFNWLLTYKDSFKNTNEQNILG
jgi:hypothetical protein